ncbi:hypothetical protein LEP1GSC040_1691 [Leptospira santarosai str. 2000030832]|uniref:Uncharacterized protein n=1 Tax=Leptospira santarosai serovar Arenal str. MAVJ 401 TaxID=1049976 RepID=M6JM93_9LEPT|nr:hypothetical protein LEP1GSC040_1691 [Leptospira santarosai str. 2000030832]EMN20700.1 hypothetical protein LEP1GSC063_2849 [Leptospira santarosai serovar Arenal str. MAVJ 401]
MQKFFFGFNDLADDIRFLKAKVLNQSQIKEFAIQPWITDSNPIYENTEDI